MTDPVTNGANGRDARGRLLKGNVLAAPEGRQHSAARCH